MSSVATGLQSLWTRVLRLLTVASALVAVVAVIGAVDQVGRPFPGFRFEPTLTISQQNDPAWNGITAGLAPLDRLLVANGQPLRHADDLSRLVRGEPVGTLIRYQVLRDSKAFEVVVPTQRLTWLDFLRSHAPPLLIGVAFLLFGGITFWIRPHLSAAQGNLVLCTSVGLFSLLGIDFDTTRQLMWGYLLVSPFIGAAGFHLAAVFPEPKRVATLRPHILWPPYALAVALVAAWIWVFKPVGHFADASAVDTWVAMQIVALLWIVLGFLALLAGVVHALVRGRTPIARLQAKTVLLGYLAAFVPSLVVSVVPVLVGMASSQSVLLSGLSTLLWILWPLSLSYAIARHRMFDIDVALRRTMVYGLLVSCLTAVYVGTLFFVGRAIEGLFGTSGGIAGNAAATAIIAILFEPVRERARALVDRLFFRTAYDFQRVVTDFGDRARDMHDPASLAEDFARTVDEALHPEFVVVLLKPEGARELIQACALGYVFASPLVLSLDNVLIQDVMAHKAEPVAFPGLGDVILRPLMLKDDLLGCVICGPRKSGADFLEQDWLLLRALGQQLAVWLNNSRLFEQLANRARELQDLVRLYEQANHDALHDPLTTLYNRRAFNDQVTKLIAGAQRKQMPLSIILLDIDYFKRFNDTYGHAAGDLAIQYVAELLKQTVRASDVAARWGGEEFIVCLPETSLRDACLVAERICARSASRDIHGADGALLPRVTVSVGVSTLGHGADDLESVVSRADQGLYIAKAKGRNQVQTVGAEASAVL